jgi:hypothetical protein
LCGEVSLIIEERETAEIDKMFEWIVECSGELCGEVNRSHFIVGIAFQHLLYMRWIRTMLDEERHERKILFDDGTKERSAQVAEAPVRVPSTWKTGIYLDCKAAQTVSRSYLAPLLRSNETMLACPWRAAA